MEGIYSAWYSFGEICENFRSLCNSGCMWPSFFVHVTIYLFLLMYVRAVKAKSGKRR